MTNTVLVVEDEPLVRLDTVDYLEECGYAVVDASDASTAITVLRARSDIDVVFTDVRMPGPLDGMALAQWIVKNRPEIAVIIASGDSAKEAALESLGGVHVFPKPYKRDSVNAKIREVLAGRKHI